VSNVFLVLCEKYGKQYFAVLLKRKPPVCNVSHVDSERRTSQLVFCLFVSFVTSLRSKLKLILFSFSTQTVQIKQVCTVLFEILNALHFPNLTLTSKQGRPFAFVSSRILKDVNLRRVTPHEVELRHKPNKFQRYFATQ